MEEHNYKNYYAIIPANVRYAKKLTPNAKLLYGEITALCNEKGYCWASNSYFADIYGVSKVSISKWIKSLVDNGYINSVITYKECSKEIDKRCLTIVKEHIEENVNTPIENFNAPIKEKFNTYLRKDNKGIKEKFNTPLRKVNTPIKEKFKENNTINNTINNNIYKKENQKWKTEIEEVVDYLNSKTNTNYKSTGEKTQRCIKARLNEGFSVDDFKKVIDTKCSEWLNTDYAIYLRPETLFGSKFEGYLNTPTKKIPKDIYAPLTKEEEEWENAHCIVC